MKHLQPLYAVSALLLATACPAAELAAPRPWLAFDRYEQYRPSFYSGKGKLENVSGGDGLLYLIVSFRDAECNSWAMF